jgi:hypothetical protein
MLQLGATRMTVASQQIVYTDPAGGVLAVESDHHGGIVFTDKQGIFRLQP